MAHDVQEGFWGDAGESIEAYYAVNDFVRQNGANLRLNQPWQRPERDQGGGAARAEPRAWPAAHFRRCRPRRGRGWPGCRRAGPARCTGGGRPDPGSPACAGRRFRPGRPSASSRNAPAPPYRTPSSAVTTSRCRAASASIAGSGGETTRASQTVASIPSAASSSAASRHAATSLPDAEQAHRAVARAQTLRAARPCRPRPGRRGGAPSWGSGSMEGPGSARAARSIGSISSAADGANTVMPGIDSASAMSRTPWWLGPSSPVMPARSSMKTTGHPWRPTSRLAWSKARQKKVEYTATTGRSPAMAMPAADVTSCCSAMPTSKNRSGKRAWKESSPVGPGMAAVSATIRGSSSATASRAWEKASPYRSPARCGTSSDAARASTPARPRHRRRNWPSRRRPGRPSCRPRSRAATVGSPSRRAGAGCRPPRPARTRAPSASARARRWGRPTRRRG